MNIGCAQGGGNYGRGFDAMNTAPAAARELEVQAGMSYLEEAAEELHQLLANLDSRLTCISRPQPPSADTSKTTTLRQSDMGRRMDALRTRMHLFSAAARDMTDRLEV